jgi:hypothetical protein
MGKKEVVVSGHTVVLSLFSGTHNGTFISGGDLNISPPINKPLAGLVSMAIAQYNKNISPEVIPTIPWTFKKEGDTKFLINIGAGQ